MAVAKDVRKPTSVRSNTANPNRAISDIVANIDDESTPEEERKPESQY